MQMIISTSTGNISVDVILKFVTEINEFFQKSTELHLRNLLSVLLKLYDYNKLCVKYIVSTN